MDRLLRSFSGARIRRVIDHSHSVVAEHAHDFPLLSIFVIGTYANKTELDSMFIECPSAILYRAGAAHQNTSGENGFEQIEIEFDPDWLGREYLPSQPLERFNGAPTAQAIRILAKICSAEIDECAVRSALRRFIDVGRQHVAQIPPDWVPWMRSQLRFDPTIAVGDLAKVLGRHPSYIGTAFRDITGESAAQVAARARIERAAKLLRESDVSQTNVAADAGFFDQSHMIRTFRRWVGRSPSAVRDDRRFMRRITGALERIGCADPSS